MAFKIGVVIPCYRVTAHILQVLEGIGPECARIYVIDDCCPDRSGDLVEARSSDPRVTVLRHPENLGVGGAVLTGYRQAISDGCDVIVKVDGDGQMDPALIEQFVAPIVLGQADYAKGNRFFDLEHIRRMPSARLIGNACLSFVSKMSTGYWNVFDPTNGYTAIHAKVAMRLPMERISRRYFFETDMLFRLNTLRAVVIDIPMHAVYGDEVSHLKVAKVLPEFALKNLQNLGKRIFYNYFLRDLSLASLELVTGAIMTSFGMVFGLHAWWLSIATGIPATTGTVMLAALPFLLGVQFLLSFAGFDIASVPQVPLHGRLAGMPIRARRGSDD